MALTFILRPPKELFGEVGFAVLPLSKPAWLAFLDWATALAAFVVILTKRCRDGFEVTVNISKVELIEQQRTHKWPPLVLAR